MGFIDINDGQKIRITLSNRARLTMSEDMDVFGVSKAATFINTVFHNYKYEAKSSISLFLQRRKLDLLTMFNESLPNETKVNIINQILEFEKNELLKNISEYTSQKGESKLYHINNINRAYLYLECDENCYYKRPSLYIRSIVEEYCTLPFIERERIYRKNIYDTVERACKERRILKIKASYLGNDQLFYVYPYKIVPDPMHTQSYLVCYSRKTEDDNMIIASFSMARMNEPTMLSKTFYLNKKEINNIDAQLTNYSPAYLTGKPELIKVRLTDKGKLSYQSRLYSRPEKIDSLSTNDIYVFDCTQQQIFNYFFSFGAEAEILSPESLRLRFENTYQKSLNMYLAKKI